MWILAMAACRNPPGEDTPEGTAAALVLMLTVDTVNAEYVGGHDGWDTTPALDAFAEDAVTFPWTYVTRGLTGVSLGSVMSGTYPRTHGQRSNESSWPGRVATVQEVLGAAGWHTVAHFSNRCDVSEVGFAEHTCVFDEKDPASESQESQDDQLVRSLLDSLDGIDGRPTFLWLHLMSPHDPYDIVQPWFDEFHPDDPVKGYDPPTREVLDALTLGDEELSDEARRTVEAAYASQVRSSDARIAEVLDALRERDLYDEAMILIGTDHGESLAVRDDYFWHGCSFYDEVQRVTWIVRAPGSLAGARVEGPVSVVDVTPTILEHAGLALDGTEGASLLPALATGEAPGRDVFFERGTDTAGMVSGTHKAVFDPAGSYDGCGPYTQDPASYSNPVLGVWDLAADPGESENLADGDPELAEAWRSRVCAWVRSTGWLAGSDDSESALWRACA